MAAPAKAFTDNERAIIRAYYQQVPADAFDLSALSAQLGRPRTSVARVARGLGLTVANRPKSAQCAARLSVSMRASMAQREHPRGFAGKHHDGETRRAIGQGSATAWAASRGTGLGLDSEERAQAISDAVSARRGASANVGGHSRTKSGYREDLGPIFFRSAWEANYARYLNMLLARGEIEAWAYEPETFWFEAIRRGVRSYKPDFKITEGGLTYFVELKGWMDARSRTCLKRMAKYHPGVDLRLVGEKEYRALAKSVAAIIPNWEHKAPRAAA